MLWSTSNEVAVFLTKHVISMNDKPIYCTNLIKGDSLNSDLSTSVSYNTVGNGLCAVPQGIEIRRLISEEMNRKPSYISDNFSCLLTLLACMDCDGSWNGTQAVPYGGVR